LRSEGVTDFAPYAAGDVDGPYAADFFVPDDAFAASGTRILHA
jgi:citronellol/citronellal dehydrogenase